MEYYVVTWNEGTKRKMESYENFDAVKLFLEKIEQVEKFSNETIYQVWIEKKKGDWKSMMNCPCVIWLVATDDIKNFNLPAGSKWKTKKAQYDYIFFKSIKDIQNSNLLIF